MKESSVFKSEDLPRSYADRIPEQTGGLYVAEFFHTALRLERKRRERSKRRLKLMLIDITRIPHDERRLLARTISHRLTLLTRETDIKGWYRDDLVIGVLFTEINHFDEQEILNKIKNGLERGLTQDQKEKMSLSIYEYPQDGKEERRGETAMSALHPDVQKTREAKKASYIVKRGIDIVGSIVGFLVFSPFFLVIPVLIKLTSRGPVLFRQKRVGLYGEHFTFLKFRTMYVNNDSRVHEDYIKQLIAGKIDTNNGAGAGEKPVYKITNDKRITPIGHFLRKTSLDELPQFINVLVGEMSLVGPRPPIPYEVESYDIWHRCRVEVKPGITGLWQVMGRSSTTFDEMVRLDIKYSREWTIGLDLKILAMTPWAVLKGKGAY